VLESLRQPMEDGVVQISRAKGTMSFPAKFLLVAASNPCPCGFLGSQKKPCICLPGQVTRYRKRVSGPILDRIDMHVSVPEVKIERLTRAKKANESSKEIRKRIQRARNKQLKRFAKFKSLIVSNSEMSNKQVKRFCPLNANCQQLMNQIMTKMNLSARGYFRLLKVSRTIADLAQEENIRTQHLAEAAQYRFVDYE